MEPQMYYMIIKNSNNYDFREFQSKKQYTEYVSEMNKDFVPSVNIDGLFNKKKTFVTIVGTIIEPRPIWREQ